MGLQIALKRFMDFYLSIAVLVLTSPFLLLAAMAIKLDSKGPVIFKQARIGKDRKSFIFYKFRSMYLNSDFKIHEEYIKKLIIQEPKDTVQEGGVYKLVSDPRITLVGKFMRRTSIDELPQLYNVLRGEMSLVGARPAIEYELKYYDQEMLERFSAKPGITGLWQVTSRSASGYKEMAKLDIYYIQNWSIWLDLKILFRTLGVVLKPKTAY